METRDTLSRYRSATSAAVTFYLLRVASFQGAVDPVIVPHFPTSCQLDCPGSRSQGFHSVFLFRNVSTTLSRGLAVYLHYKDEAVSDFMNAVSLFDLTS
jgi:hypothetical protein